MYKENVKASDVIWLHITKPHFMCNFFKIYTCTQGVDKLYTYTQGVDKLYTYTQGVDKLYTYTQGVDKLYYKHFISCVGKIIQFLPF